MDIASKLSRQAPEVLRSFELPAFVIHATINQVIENAAETSPR
jgi:hypothetical protein